MTTTIQPSDDWGFCSKLCDSESHPEQLMEAKLKILSIDECAVFNSSTLSYRQNGEICAANKIPYPTMKVYIRKKLRRARSGKKYVFVQTKDKKNTVRDLIFRFNMLE